MVQMESPKAVYIKSISIVGFKSFGSTKQTIAFGPGLNLLAGPNGAGKSNILDAVSFALCAKPATLRVQHLHELQSSDTDEPCVVELQIASQNDGKALRMFELEARVLPDSTRQYRIDGKQKTMKDVKEFLRENHLLVEDAFAVLQQARVTELADSNSPALLASAISGASGAGRWNDEVGRATDEMLNTRKSLASINQNVSMLERAIVADEERVRAMDHQRQLEHEIDTLEARLRDYARRKLSFLKDEYESTKSQITALDAEKQTLAEELRKNEENLTQARPETNEETCQSTAVERVSLLEALAQTEELMRVDERRLEEGRTANLQMQQLEVEISQLHRTHKEALQALKEKQSVVARMEQDKLRFKCLGDQSDHEYVHDLIVTLAADLKIVEDSCNVKKRTVEEAAAELATTEAALNKLRASASNHQELIQASEEARQKDCVERARHVEELKRLRQRKAELGKLSDSAERKARVAAALLGELSQAEEQTRARSFFSVFQFKPDLTQADCERLSEALKALSGSLRGICIVNDIREAGRLLELWQSTSRDSRFKRIWPLDRLTSPDLSQKQRLAQQHFSAGEVILPLDLLQYDPKFAKALKKAFGGYVIAANDQVARELITRYGLWNVTLDGKVSRSGTVQGGWRGSDGHSLLLEKFQCDSLWRQLNSLQESSTAVDQAFDKLIREESQLARAILEEEARMQALQETMHQQHAIEVKLFQDKLTKEEAEKKLEVLQNDVVTKKERLEEYTSLKESGSKEEAFARALEVAVQDELAQQSLVDEVLQRLEEAKEKEASLKEQADALRSIDFAERIRQNRERLERLHQDLARSDVIQASLAREQAERALESERALKAAQECKRRTLLCEKQAERLQKQRNQLEKTMRACEDEIAQLSTEYEDGEQSSDSERIKDEKQFAAAKARRRNLLSEKEGLAAKQQRVTIDEQVAFKERVENLQVFKDRAESLLLSIEKLKEGIDMTRDRVQQANESTFQRIRTMFINCCKSLLPDKRVDLVKIKDRVEDGVRFLFQNAAADRTEGPGQQALQWKSNLGELSGGQRTMLSLAFVLTVAMNGRSSLYIMDEVDAALDEQNQRRVAALVKDVISKKSQVLCVSHNRSFQMFSDNVIQLSRREGSSKADASFAADTSMQKKHRQA